jgi:predicted oxidoreductase
MTSRVDLAPGGPNVSELVYGTWRILNDAQPPTSAGLADRFDACIDVGITTIDTAEIYGNYRVEAAIGASLGRRTGLRDRLEIVTKCGIDVPSDEKRQTRVSHYNATAENIVQCAEKSLRLLNTDRIDIFLIHRPDWLTAADETAAGLNRLVKEGKILHAGVSNYNVHEFNLLNDRMDRPLVTNQIQLSLLHMEAMKDGTLRQCEQLRVRPMAWSPLAGGRLFDTQDDAARRIESCMQNIRDRYAAASRDALAIAWILAHPARPVAVLGTNKIHRIRSAATASELRLDRQDWYALWEAAQGRNIP